MSTNNADRVIDQLTQRVAAVVLYTVYVISHNSNISSGRAHKTVAHNNKDIAHHDDGLEHTKKLHIQNNTSLSVKCNPYISNNHFCHFIYTSY